MNNASHIISIDPGLNCGLSVISIEERKISPFDIRIKSGTNNMVRSLMLFTSEHMPKLVRPGDEVALRCESFSTSSMQGCVNIGTILGCVASNLLCMGVEVDGEYIHPRTWKSWCKREYDGLIPGKELSTSLINEIFGSELKSNDVCDSILIGLRFAFAEHNLRPEMFTLSKVEKITHGPYSRRKIET